MNAPGQDTWLKKHGARRTSLWSLGAVLTALGIAAAGWLAWSWYDARYPSWKEEVQLSDGRVITVKQKRQYFENYGTNQSWVTFSLPEMGGERTWHSYLRPQRVDVHDGRVYVFGSPRGIRQFVYYRYPKHYLVAFIWNGSEFERVPFMSIPPELRELQNIYPCERKSRRPLTLEEKARTWCEPTGNRGQLTRHIHLQEYEKLAAEYARLDGGKPLTE